LLNVPTSETRRAQRGRGFCVAKPELIAVSKLDGLLPKSNFTFKNGLSAEISQNLPSEAYLEGFKVIPGMKES
jgi:hypothetical protein